MNLLVLNLQLYSYFTVDTVNFSTPSPYKSQVPLFEVYFKCFLTILTTFIHFVIILDILLFYRCVYIFSRITFVYG